MQYASNGENPENDAKDVHQTVEEELNHHCLNSSKRWSAHRKPAEAAPYCSLNPGFPHSQGHPQEELRQSEVSSQKRSQDQH